MNLIGNVGLVTSLQDFTSSTALAGASSVVETEINGVLYFFVAGTFDSGIQVLKLVNGTLEIVSSIVNAASVNLASPQDLEIVEVGSRKFLIVSAVGNAAITSLEIEQGNTGTDGTLTHVQSIADGSVGGPLLSNVFEIEQVAIGASRFIVTAANNDDALSVYRIGVNGFMTLVDTLTDAEGANLNLDTVRALTSAQVGTRTFIYTGTSSSDDGISVFEMATDGTLTSVQNVDFTTGVQFRAMTFVENDAGRFLIAANNTGNYDLFVYRVAANGTLTQLSNYSTFFTTAAGTPQFFNIFDIETYTIDGATFIFATSNASDAAIVYSLDDDGTITYVNSLTRTEFDGAYGMTTFTRDGKHYLALTGQNASRLSIVEIGGGDDPIVATGGADRLVGLDGDDDLVALAGNDSLYGGRGDDVLSGRLGNDLLDGGANNDVLIGGGGNDTLRGGSGADVLIGNAGTDLVSYVLSVGAVNVNLLAGTATGGDANGDLFFTVEGLIGSSRNDTLSGNDAANSLFGGDGNDSLLGLGGGDFIYGGRGNDRILGGAAADRLYGDTGNDVLNGEDGNDLLRGGNNNDTLQGAAGNDQLFGDAGNDRLIGDLGDDTLDGGTGADLFVFALGFGSDEINGFVVAEDRLDLSALPTINSLADFQAAAITFGGNTVLNLPDGSSIFITGVLESQFTAANFVF